MSTTPLPMPDWLVEHCRLFERYMVPGYSPLGLAAVAYLAGWDAAASADRSASTTTAGEEMVRSERGEAS